MADADLTKAADSVRKLKSFVDAITVIGAFADDLNAMDQLAVETRQRLQQAKSDEAAAQARLSKLADALALAEADVKRAQAKAVETEQAAQRAASVVAARAKDDAARVVTEAMAEAERIKSPLHPEIAALLAKKADIQSDLDGLLGAVSDAKMDLTTLNTQLAEARAAIAKLLGG